MKNDHDYKALCAKIGPQGMLGYSDALDLALKRAFLDGNRDHGGTPVQPIHLKLADEITAMGVQGWAKADTVRLIAEWKKGGADEPC